MEEELRGGDSDEEAPIVENEFNDGSGYTERIHDKVRYLIHDVLRKHQEVGLICFIQHG